MTFDAGTVALMTGLIVTLCAVTFILNTTLRRHDLVSRLWSVAFTAAIFQTLAYAVWAIDTSAWWGLALGNGAYVVALGMFWSGLRRANGRTALLWVPLLAGLIVAVAVLARGPDGGPWAGAPEMFFAIAGFAVFGTIETLVGNLRRNLNARTLTVVFIVVGAFYLTRVVVLLAVGSNDPTFLAYFGPTPAVLVNLCLVVLATVSLSIIQAERFGSPGRIDRVSEVAAVDGIAGSQLFRELAESWLLRSVRERSTLVLIVFELANLDEINVAFGRAAGERAIRLVAREAVTRAPAAALVGQVGPERFAVLLTLPLNEDVSAVADRISAAILNSPLDDADRFRASTFVGLASTRTSGSRYDGLLEAATDAVSDAVRVAAIRAGDGTATASRWKS